PGVAGVAQSGAAGGPLPPSADPCLRRAGPSRGGAVFADNQVGCLLAGCLVVLLTPMVPGTGSQCFFGYLVGDGGGEELGVCAGPCAQRPAEPVTHGLPPFLLCSAGVGVGGRMVLVEVLCSMVAPVLLAGALSLNVAYCSTQRVGVARVGSTAPTPPKGGVGTTGATRGQAGAVSLRSRSMHTSAGTVSSYPPL